jgi:succinate dehydrogenase hydrophobic anchor subunit
MKVLVLFYLLVGVAAMLYATKPSAPFIQGYHEGRWRARSVVFWSLLTVFIWPYFFWVGISSSIKELNKQ